MNEKRFTKDIQCFIPCYFDNGKPMSANKVLECLNALNDENKKLKKDIDYYKTERTAFFEYLDKKDNLSCDIND